MITITGNAKSYLKTITEQNSSKYVLLSVKGGGCSGFKYDWSFSDEPGDNSLVDDILIIDKLAEMFVAGCTVDYKQSLGGSYLAVVNPNASAQCGCGESFHV